MPLIIGSSPRSMSANIRSEMSAGKPQPQAVAIAYAKKREALKRRAMWRGGEVDESDHDEFNETPTEERAEEQEFEQHPLMTIDIDDFEEPEEQDAAPPEPENFAAALKRRKRGF